MFVVHLYLWSGGEVEFVPFGTFDTWKAAHEWAVNHVRDQHTDWEIVECS